MYDLSQVLLPEHKAAGMTLEQTTLQVILRDRNGKLVDNWPYRFVSFVQIQKAATQHLEESRNGVTFGQGDLL